MSMGNSAESPANVILGLWPSTTGGILDVSLYCRCSDSGWRAVLTLSDRTTGHCMERQANRGFTKQFA
jgi:hypothetical protein